MLHNIYWCDPTKTHPSKITKQIVNQDNDVIKVSREAMLD